MPIKKLILGLPPTAGTITTAGAEPGWLPDEAIIPFLPNDVAWLCLARVPKQYHSVLSAVSKTLRSVVRSPEFFAFRSRLNLSEEILYFRVQLPFDTPVSWFALSQGPSGIALFPVPPLPEPILTGPTPVVIGSSMFLIGGGKGKRTSDVWVYDCASNRLSPGPSMASARMSAGATLLEGKIYVVGGAASGVEPIGEVLDPATGQWRALPDPGRPIFIGDVEDCQALSGRIHVWTRFGNKLVFDPTTQAWETIRKEVCRASRCAVDGRLYCYNGSSNRIEWFDETEQGWKEMIMESASEWLRWGWGRKGWKSPRLVNSRGRLMVINCRERYKNFEVALAEVVMGEDGLDGVTARPLWSQKLVADPLLPLVSLVYRKQPFFDCNYLSVCL